MIDLNRKLPIGIQTFEDIRKEGYLYVCLLYTSPSPRDTR